MTRMARIRGGALLAAVVALTTMTAGVALPRHPGDGAWTETRTQTYDTGDFGPMPGMWGCSFTGRNGATGSVCLGATVGDTFTVTIDDDSGRTVGGFVEVRTDEGWTTVSPEPFCGTSRRLSSTQGNVVVHLDAPGDATGAHWHGGPGCSEVGLLGQPVGTLGATRGRVHVTFTGRGDREGA